MNTKAEQPKGTNAADIGKLVLAGLVLVAGIVAYSWFGRDGSISSSVRLLGVLAALVIALAIAAFTALQRRRIESKFLYFPDESHWVQKPKNSVLWHDTVNAWLKYHLQPKQDCLEQGTGNREQQDRIG